MKWTQVLILQCILIPLIVSAAEETDYCNLHDCWENHIACKNDGKLGPLCPNDTHDVQMDNHKELILLLHNDKRNEIARGKKPLKPAARMAEMAWDDELAQMALLNSRTCKMKNDKCRNLKRFRHSGQNVGMFSYSGDPRHMTVSQLIKDQIDAWLETESHVTPEIIDSYPKKSKANQFTVIVSERNTHVGCGAVRYKEGDMNKFLLTCNYAYNNIVGMPVYTTSRRAASGCESGKSRSYSKLCSTKEEYEAITKPVKKHVKKKKQHKNSSDDDEEQ